RRPGGGRDRLPAGGRSAVQARTRLTVRLRLDLAYDGTDFHGWATQPGLRTVQGVLEGALCTVLRVPALRVTCAGRTDTGVHARHQVAHADVDDAAGSLTAALGGATDEAVGRLAARLNRLLDADVRVRRVSIAPDGFDARFSALARCYRYRICDDPVLADPLSRHEVLTWPRALGIEMMAEASLSLLGEHDFAAFCKRRAGATTVRELHEFSWTRAPAGLVVATVRADAFCHHMVRSLVGCLLAVGDGSRPPDWPTRLLVAGVRDSTAQVAPAHGLTLESVSYPDAGQLAARAEATRRVRR
ncbi:MAG: tRNA pseudouridine(38-40) synthase TruA, partial [Nocardioides sp.]